MVRRFKRKLTKRYYLKNKGKQPKKFRTSLRSLPVSVPLAILPGAEKVIKEPKSFPLSLRVSIPLASLPNNDDSVKYKASWSSIINSAETEASPTLHYFITRYLLNDLLQKMHPVSTTPDNTSNEATINLSSDEEAALSYVGGYVVRAMIKKVKKSSEDSHKKKLLIIALDKFHEHPDDVNVNVNEDDQEQEQEPDWLTLCNRGGLYLVRTEFQNFLLSVEIIVKKMTKKIERTGIQKDKIFNEVKEDEDVLFWWEILCSTVMVDSETSQQLLGLIIQHYIVVRGFAVTARWLENFKINQKKIFRKLKDLERNC